MAVQAVDLQDALVHAADAGIVVGQRGAALRGDLQNARLGEARVHGVGGAQQFERGAHAGRGEVVGLDGRGADHEDVVFLGDDVGRVARVHEARGALQRDFGGVHADDFATHAAQFGPVFARAQTPAIEEELGLAEGARRKVVECLGAVPVRGDAKLLHALVQRGEQLAVVELSFARQVQALVKAPGERGFVLCQLRVVQGLGGGEVGQQALGAQEFVVQRGRVGGVLPVPDDEGAVALEEHGAGQRGEQLGPAPHGMLAHAHDGGFADGGFGQRGEHGGGHARGGLVGVGPAGVVDFKRVAVFSESDGEQPAHEARAEHGDAGGRAGEQWHRFPLGEGPWTKRCAAKTPYASMIWIR